jgi:levansucrase
MTSFHVPRSMFALALLPPAFALTLLPPTASRAQDPVGEPAGDFTARWTPEQARLIELTTDQTTPVIPEAVREAEPMLPGYYVWDSWPMRNRDGSVAVVDGWQVLVALTAPTTVLPGTRHDIATYRYFISRDGQELTICSSRLTWPTQSRRSTGWSG